MATNRNRESSKAEQLTVAMKNVSSPAALYDDFRMTMDASFNWEQLLSPAPLGISVLGDLMVVASSMSDFRLDESGQGKEYMFMRYPESFRASLVQVSNSGYQAFMQAHTNMDQIRLYAANVPSYMKEATKILMSKNAKQITKFLPTPLERIREAAERSVTLSLAVTQSFEQVIGLTNEILEAVTATKGLKEQQNDENRSKKEILDKTVSATENMLEDARKHKENLEKMVKETQDELREARNRMPTGMDIIGMKFTETFADFGRTLIETSANILTLGLFKNISNATTQNSNPPSNSSGGATVTCLLQNSNPPSNSSGGATVTTCIDDECLLQNRKFILDASSVADVLHETALNGYKKKSKKERSKQYDGSIHLDKLQDIAMEASGCHELEEICEEGIEIIKTLQNILQSETPSKAQEMNDPIRRFQKKAKSLANKVKTMSSVIPQRTPYMSNTLTTSGKASQLVVAQAQQRVESAEVRLKEVRQSAEKARDEMINLNKDYTERLAEMQRLKISEINCKEAIELLQKGLSSLGKLKEHWYGLVLFFSRISNVVKVIMSKSLVDFSTSIQTTSTDLDLLDKVTLDIIYMHAMKASQASYFVHNMADTYTKVSNRFIMPNIVKLDQMIACDRNKPGMDIELMRESLLHACQRDSQGIIDLIMENKQTLINQAEERMNTIKQQFAILAIEDEDDSNQMDELNDF